MDGMEITQFTYFQMVGVVELKPITGEITYGIERLAMYLQRVNNVYDLQWNDRFTYGDIYHRNEVEWSHYNFEKASVEMWQRHFEDYEKEAKSLVKDKLPIPAYDFVMKASHAFNILDARGAISVTERTGYVGRIRELAHQVAITYIASRENQQFPLLTKLQSPSTFSTFQAALSLPESLKNVHPDNTEDYLLEVGSEELPASFVSIGIQNLEKQIRNLLEKEGLAYQKITTYATARRLVIYIHQLVKGTPSQVIERKGPPLEQAYHSHGELKTAGEGFFRSIGITPPLLESIQKGTVAGIEVRKIKETTYLFGKIYQEGRATAAILQEQLPSLILRLDFPKKMRWGASEITYARPIRWILSLFGQENLPIQVGSIQSSNHTYGHPQLSPKKQIVEKAQDYVNILRQNFVMVDVEERQQEIRAQLKAIENKYTYKIIEQERLLSQITYLVEWPSLSLSSFDAAFLKIPREVLISEMVEHQKYFPVENRDGCLQNAFVITANVIPTAQIEEGNQRVLSARLADGKFLYEEDLKHPMSYFNEKLKKVIFQKDLGTIYQKVERIIAHAQVVQKMLGISNSYRVERAALLCKVDLTSLMVYEFPDLQGIIGSYYALAQQEDPEVAQAICEHWMPLGENSLLPATETGIIISLADKIDNLLACFSLGLTPTSSSDPYALRRQVLGIIKILIKGKYDFPLKDCFLVCANHFSTIKKEDKDKLVNEILTFVINRMKNVFQEYGLLKDEVEATLSYGVEDIYDAFCRVKALHDFRIQSKQQFNSLFEVYKRAKGQLNHQQTAQVSIELLREPAERYLYTLLDSQKPAFQNLLAEKKYYQAYTLIATLQPALADLFEQVKILTDEEELRKNRLSLLKNVFDLFGQILDFSKIQEKN
jgi:glycyl-tRNA synthetase